MENIYNSNIIIQNPLVSISCITFNHENYIEQCLNGILNQVVDFEFEVIVGDDCSTDNTFNIIKGIQKKHNVTIKIIRSKKNIGARRNAERNRKNCRGKYIAICEGDDYWTDPLKLQKQIDFLENNKEFVLCYTDIQHYIESEQRFIDFLQSSVDNIDIHDLFEQNYVTTLTAVYRNDLVKFSSDFEKISIGDWPLFVLISQYGKIKRMPFISGVYRVHSSNYFQANTYLQKKVKVTEATEFLYKQLQPAYKNLAKQKLINSYFLLSVLSFQSGNIQEALSYFDKLKELVGAWRNLKVIKLRLIVIFYQLKNRYLSR